MSAIRRTVNVLYRKSERRCGVCACRLTEANTSGVCRKHNHAAGVCKCARCAA